MLKTDLSSTIVALATPPGIGAIGIIRLSGSEAFGVADAIFLGKKLAKQKSYTAHFGRIVRADGSILDEVLATVFVAPHSFSGENTVEFSCHGSPFILQEAIGLCLKNGARLAQPGEFTMRSFLNGKMDLSQAEAVADLIASQSEAAHGVAIRQLRGGFKNEISRLREELIHFASLVELELDFGEEDVEFADRQDLKNLVERIRAVIGGLLKSFSLGNALKNGVSTVIAGRPNAGKSTLLNALLNENRAIVSEIAGTTRDTIEEILNINGVQFRLIDTAGIREAQDKIEAFGVEKTMEKIGEASVLIYVFDVVGGMDLTEVHADLASLSKLGNLKLLVVCNKMDKNPHFRPAWLVNPNLPDVFPYLKNENSTAENLIGLTENQIITVSAKNQQNIEFLKEKLFETVADGLVNLESTVVTNARHFDALRRSDEALADVLTGLETGITGDFVAQDIRRSLAFLGEISGGSIDPDEILGSIFSKFCIGK